jgi:5-methyltetrahydrofolate--homocysteine methyltransferase
MERLGFKTPLLIGGATTSRIHAAVKIAPQYSGDIVHVLDASRSVTVVGSLLGKGTKQNFSEKIKRNMLNCVINIPEENRIRNLFPFRPQEKIKYRSTGRNYDAPIPSFTGNKVFEDFPLEKIRPRIDWTPFFQTWELHGKFPAILSDPIIGTEATRLYDDANKLLDEVISKKLLRAKGVIGFYPARGINDDDIEITISIEPDASKKMTFHFLRQQGEKALSQKYFCLADFIQPQDNKPEDYLGFFAVTAGLGIEALIEKFEREHDDYNSILIKSLADRLAEGFAETMHELVRKEYWRYAKDEHLTTEQIIKEEYTGIRPAPGYPACPDHTEKAKIFELLDAENKVGIRLTENFAMYPASSVCGFYFSHPQSNISEWGKLQETRWRITPKEKA